MSDSASDSVERRLARLEQRWRAAAALAAVCGVAATTGAFIHRGEPPVRTSRLELVDSTGRVRATLDVGGAAAAWTLVDTKGATVAALTLEETGQIVVRDEEGRVQATLGPATVHRLRER